MKTNYLIWMSTPVNNACWLSPLKNLEKTYLLPRGLSLAATWPSNVETPMNKRFKKATALTDDLNNSDSVKICSPRLVAFLQERQLKNLEYLPVAIRDHKGKVASKDYRIVNPVGLQDGLDFEASKPTYNLIQKAQIDHVETLVLDVARIDPEVKIFRLKGLYHPVLIARDLAESIKAAGFVGPYFRELEDYGS